MLHIFYGADTYSRSEAVNRLKQELDDGGMLSANTVSFDGAQVDMAVLMATCDTVPFLAGHRLVIVTDLLGQARARPARSRNARRGRTEAGAGAAVEELADYVPRLPATTTLVLLEGDLRDDNPQLALLRPLARLQAFPRLTDRRLEEWVRARARALGATFDPAAVRLLVQSVHADLWTMAGEVDKLSLYAAGRAVTEDDVRALVAAAQESNIFALVDAIAEGRGGQALLQLDRLIQHGAAGPYVLTMIARLYRQLIIAEDMLKAGSSPAAIASAADIRSESALRRLLTQARRVDAPVLQQRLERVLETDLEIKRGEADERVALQILVAELATPAQRARANL